MKVTLLLVALMVASAAAVPAASQLQGVPPIIDDLIALLMSVIEHIYEWIVAHLLGGQPAPLGRAELRAALAQQAPQLLARLQQQLAVSRAQLAELLREAEQALARGQAPPPQLLGAVTGLLADALAA
ncbi:uncharacterized protein LOC122384977 [Amphibalanus amphitrite]|uniref:uncharacterized protein LOC122373675 n=1 Tax=Amphibalanus amphitrite TaxID=1232801 RepID=UPI001C904528|nr:uncharacterized protein LOC122373675 [Amphibalanus amphitrite]XP_043228788.1 uncharacterized protein LOC122384977 [Amphibalanus amphitrite]